LDILWSLAFLTAAATEEHGSWAINAIAAAAAFEVNKQIEVSERVLTWLEKKIEEPSTIESLHRKAWILSALLKPFFVSEVQEAQQPGTGNTVVISRFHLRAEKARLIRQRALAIIEKILESPDKALVCAVVPVLAEAIKPPEKSFEKDQEFWRKDCLEVLKRIEGVVEARQDSTTLLLQIRGVLLNRWQPDQDPILRGERERILKKFPDTCGLRVARVLTCYSFLEFPGPPLISEQEKSKERWAEFERGVAREVVERCKNAHELCDFLSHTVRELEAVSEHVRPAAMLHPLAQFSPAWCAALLNELVGTADPTLDRGLWPVIHCAVANAPEAYRNALEVLPSQGRSTQLCELISFLGWKQLHGGRLTPFERDAVLAAVRRNEEPVVCELASLCELSSKHDPKWAVDVLSQLRPAGKRSGSAIMERLGFIVKEHASHVTWKNVAECLGNVGEFCFPESGTSSFCLENVSQWFPKQVYEHVRRLCEMAESKPAQPWRRRISEIPSLGPLGDAEYVDREIRALWDRAVTSEADSFSQEFRLALIRSLLWADAASAPDRLRQFVTTCKNGDEIEMFAKLVGTRPSRFVFNFPDVVRSILARGQELGAMNEVTKTLLLAACVGSRTPSDSELDPEHKYILEQGDALANRYRDDPFLRTFYRGIANWERSDLERQRQRRSK
jgi:hypothetical protein